jgi:hypothetical protein
MDIDAIFTSTFAVLHSVFNWVRTILTQTIPGYMNIALIVLAGIGAFYLAKKYPRLDGWITIVTYGLLIYLAIRFI